jgi:hypothetical protein
MRAGPEHARETARILRRRGPGRRSGRRRRRQADARRHRRAARDSAAGSVEHPCEFPALLRRGSCRRPTGWGRRRKDLRELRAFGLSGWRWRRPFSGRGSLGERRIEHSRELSGAVRRRRRRRGSLACRRPGVLKHLGELAGLGRGLGRGLIEDLDAVRRLLGRRRRLEHARELAGLRGRHRRRWGGPRGRGRWAWVDLGRGDLDRRGVLGFEEFRELAGFVRPRRRGRRRGRRWRWRRREGPGRLSGRSLKHLREFTALV